MKRTKCKKCNGRGYYNYGDFHIPNTKHCDECKGTGWIEEDK